MVAIGSRGRGKGEKGEKNKRYKFPVQNQSRDVTYSLGNAVHNTTTPLQGSDGHYTYGDHWVYKCGITMSYT